MHLRTPCAFLILLVFLGALLAGCKREAGPDAETEVKRLNAELEAARQKLSAAEKNLSAKEDELVLAAAATETAQKQSAERDQIVLQNDAQLRALQAEMANLKKRDAFVFAEASAVQQKGLTTIALDRYQQFLKDFPKSPLAVDANRAIAELTVTAGREARVRANLIDPKRPERELLKRFGDGIVTVEEIAPLLKKKTVAEVVKLLGPPNQTFRDGREIGYVNKVIDSATGGKGTLVIGFESQRVSSLRVGYQGREIKP